MSEEVKPQLYAVCFEWTYDGPEAPPEWFSHCEVKPYEELEDYLFGMQRKAYDFISDEFLDMKIDVDRLVRDTLRIHRLETKDMLVTLSNGVCIEFGSIFIVEFKKVYPPL